jgi:hypothetical protein
VCLIDDETGSCVGCFRTVDEISRWSTMTDRERRAVMATLPAREKDVPQTKG